MSDFLQHYTLQFTPLSPIHMGSDESYEPGNYVIDTESGALYGFDTQAALSGLTATDRNQLLGLLNRPPDDQMLTDVQAFFHNHRDKLIAYARSPIPTASGVKQLYEKRIGKTAQHEGRGRRVIHKLEIDRTFYNPIDNLPILPGSGIKGAIRTALLDGLNQGQKLTSNRERNQELQQRLFEGGRFHTDPMRLVSVGDACWQGSNDHPACEIQFAVNRKRQPVVDDNGQLRRAMGENLSQLLECIAPYHYRSFNGSLTLHDPHSIRQDDRKLPTKNLQWSIQDIAKACNAFYTHLLIAEVDALKNRDYLDKDWDKNLTQVLQSGLVKRLNNGEAFLLRLGRHSGAEALTLNGVRNIRIMKGGGQPAEWSSKPKTWWLAADHTDLRTGLLPFGWVLVEINPKQPDDALKNWLENGDQGMQQWMQVQTQKQQGLKQQAEQLQAKQLAEQQAKQEQLEEQRLKDEQEKQRLASLSPLDQDIEAFLKPIQAAEHDTRLLQELEKGRWQDEDAQQVAEKIKTLMEQADKWMPDFTGTNKQKIKLKERSLQVQRYLRGSC